MWAGILKQRNSHTENDVFEAGKEKKKANPQLTILQFIVFCSIPLNSPLKKMLAIKKTDLHLGFRHFKVKLFPFVLYFNNISKQEVEWSTLSI